MIDPAKRVSKKVYNKTLKEVNKILVANGKKPLSKMPNGEPNDECLCPIARALRPVGIVAVSGSDMIATVTVATKGVKVDRRDLEDDQITVWGPEVFHTFVQEFDNGLEGIDF